MSRKTEAERRAFLKDFKERMADIEQASRARLGDVQVSEQELDTILKRVDEEPKETT